jgi:hypothetical protein
MNQNRHKPVRIHKKSMKIEHSQAITTKMRIRVNNSHAHRNSSFAVSLTRREASFEAKQFLPSV